MKQLTKQLSFYILSLISISVCSSGLAATEIILPPNQPVVLTNTNPTTINLLCVVKVPSQQAISIKITNGKGSFNGTTFSPGSNMTALLYNTQSVPIIATPGTRAIVTNLGSYVMKASC